MAKRKDSELLALLWEISQIKLLGTPFLIAVGWQFAELLKLIFG